ncbi:PREDICTED: E3 ubiquitin-protein ligase ATL4-like [Nelumbo nucifera]|uniref:RING-type E3 ubiquitin transferase n=2 Tax=Nelumbo nucifera TaxID=4432 RepID=A0A1U8B1H8_NELNU|nr:PREDICTED: E3 ubiquitin-protein ligase ATL4-like [Nelumbo nucifera]DAD18252.1 TPA_asm: hypothetical protein HUJ06_019715 [Nelumbo nucifera]
MSRRLDIFIFAPLPSPPPPPPPLQDNVARTGEATFDQARSHGGGSSSSNVKPSFEILSLILAVVVLASLSLHLLLRCLKRSSSSDDAVLASAEPHPVSRVSNRQVSPANQSLIESLPLFSFDSVSGLRSSSFSPECAVCLSKFEPHDLLRRLPLCLHAFHSDCIDTWLASHQTCPLCRSAIHVSESELASKLSSLSARGDSFRIEIGSVSRDRTPTDHNASRRSYSMGEFNYVVEQECEVVVPPTHRRGASECISNVKEKDSGGGGREPPVNTPSLALALAHAPASAPAPAPLFTPAPPGSELAAEVAGGRAWLKDYVDRLASSASSSFSSRTLSLGHSGRFFSGSSSRRSEGFGGSSRRSDDGTAGFDGGNWDLEGNRVGEEISSFFRWLSGV